jgi:hypothetical protein
VALSAHTPAFEARQGKCEASRIAALPFAATAYQALLFLNASAGVRWLWEIETNLDRSAFGQAMTISKTYMST